MSCSLCIKKYWDGGVKYTKAVAAWVAAGSPVRSPEEITENFETCKKCENFIELKDKPWRGKCGVCGCYLGRHVKRFIIGNKIAMATEKCPEGKW